MAGSASSTLAPAMMPIVQQPRRPLGRESFRQRNIGCASNAIPQNLVFRAGEHQAMQQANLNIDNCFILKSQLRRYHCIARATLGFQLWGIAHPYPSSILCIYSKARRDELRMRAKQASEILFIHYTLQRASKFYYTIYSEARRAELRMRASARVLIAILIIII